MTLPYDTDRFAECSQTLIAITTRLAARGWTPATSSNFSMRISPHYALITVSGRDKGQLTANDFMAIDFDGQAVASTQRPSAETLLHAHLYRRLPDVDCVLHTHSHTQTVASRLFAGSGRVHFEGYELIKAIAGNTTHDATLTLPVLPNTQDMSTLAAQVEALLDAGPLWGYLIDGHGLYAWGRSHGEACRHLEAFDFLLGCELDLLRIAPQRASRIC
ncbi:MAG: methylthioribulose-1-phosphate dehydratase [Lysobacterales bacterium CG17_big_fil_post_rev_8_21_14_2_50_64_11]|nr:MAG: methylthioribulose-1-phosphate dehydratase [Xanthomonadales bacterium CG17_big_fil_post_rev_8_21_14_2_50_64_11]PIX61556.1 MAG: methylthioribulose-1-phosphate dehydratase [Xanthomonadales bacterium CG_4_10_14_3_um_filter_64_11]